MLLQLKLMGGWFSEDEAAGSEHEVCRLRGRRGGTGR